MAMRSPSRSTHKPSTGAPFRLDPFADPRSSSTHPAPRRSIRACARETAESLRTTSLWPARPRVTPSASNRYRVPRRSPAEVVRANGTSVGRIEEHLVDDRAEEHQEEGRKDEEDEGQQQLHRRLVGELLGALRALRAELRREQAEHLAERSPHPIR